MISFVALGGNSRLAKCFSDLFPDISVNVDKSLCDITNKKDIEKVLNPKKTLIVRTSFYYKDLYLIKGLFKNQSVSAYKNMYFNPISINRAAKEIYKNRNKKGVINIFSSKKISKYHFAMKVCKVFDTDKKLVKPVSFVNKVGFALRPPDSSIDSNIAINLDKDLFQFKKYIKIR